MRGRHLVVDQLTSRGLTFEPYDEPTGPEGDQHRGFWDVDEVQPPQTTASTGKGQRAGRQPR